MSEIWRSRVRSAVATNFCYFFALLGVLLYYFFAWRVEGDVLYLVMLFSGQSVTRRLREDARGERWVMLHLRETFCYFFNRHSTYLNVVSLPRLSQETKPEMRGTGEVYYEGKAFE